MARALFVAVLILIMFGFLWFRRQKSSATHSREVILNPKALLFSLPTISNDFPAMVEGRPDPTQDAISITEDDWRQVEFIENAALPEIEREMREIEAFKKENRVGLGWENVYVRKQRPDGLYPSRLSLSLVDSVPHGPIQKLLIGSPDHESPVKGGFAIRLGPSLIMYGRESSGILINLGLSRLPNDEHAALEGHLLAICKKFDLVIVDWCAGRIFPPRSITSQ